MDSRVLTAHVPLPLAQKVDELAARLDRPRGWVVKQALTDWVEQEEERFRLTKMALSDVDEGRVVSHARMRAWAASLDTDEPLPVPHP
jgi:predicted transcriptional regulator